MHSDKCLFPVSLRPQNGNITLVKSYVASQVELLLIPLRNVLQDMQIAS
jgi:hypothetical protein